MVHSQQGKYRVKILLLILLALCVIFLFASPLSRYDTAILRRFIVEKVPIKEKIIEIPLKYRMNLVKWFGFSEENSLKEWEEKVFKDKVIYRIEKGEDLSYARATSKAAASALYYKIDLDAKTKRPLVSWRWKVEKFPEKKLPESLDTKEEDDFAARVYVIFPAKFFTNSKVLEYVWTETLPEEMLGTSPYSHNIKLIVAHSGLDENKGWCLEERDVIADYKRAFGRFPEYNIGAVAFMTNAEHTGTSADAMYDDIKIGYKESSDTGGGDIP